MVQPKSDVILGAAIVDAILPGTLNVRTQLGGGTSIARGLFIEMFMTAMLMITMSVAWRKNLGRFMTWLILVLVCCLPPKSTRRPSWLQLVLGKLIRSFGCLST